MLIRGSLVSLSLLALPGPLPSWPIVEGHHLQPTQWQVDNVQSQEVRGHARAVQQEVDALYRSIMRAAEPNR